MPFSFSPFYVKRLIKLFILSSTLHFDILSIVLQYPFTPQPPSQILSIQHSFQMQAPGPLPAPTRQAVFPNGYIARRTLEPPLSLQRQHSGTAPGDMEYSRATEEGPGLSRDGGSLTCTADGLSFCPPRIPHTFTVRVATFAFHTEDPDGVGDARNIFLFLDISRGPIDKILEK